MLPGLMNASATFQRIATEMRGDLDFIEAHIDEVVVYSNSIAEHTVPINVVSEYTRCAGLKSKVQKYCFAKKKVEFFGFL